MPTSPMPNPRDYPDPIGYAVASADWWHARVHVVIIRHQVLSAPTAAGRAASHRERGVTTDVQIEQVPAEARKVDAADAAVRDPGRPRADPCDRPGRSGLANDDRHELSLRSGAIPAGSGTELEGATTP